MEYPSIKELREGAFLLIDKPYTWTSFDVIGKLRSQTHVKMGHAGTLDPLATGLLIICTSRMTKKINEYMGQDKTYEGVITIGSRTETYDLESEPTEAVSTSHIGLDEILKARDHFLGEFKQMPPMHSAIKKDGKRLYKYARKGQKVYIEPRDVRIERFDIVEKKENEIRFEVRCGTGTYIRSLAHDMGELLGVGAYLSSLRRTAIGDFSVADAYELHPMVEHYRKQEIPRKPN